MCLRKSAEDFSILLRTKLLEGRDKYVPLVKIPARKFLAWVNKGIMKEILKKESLV